MTPPRFDPRRQDGFTMAVTMMILFVGSLVSIAAWQTASGDLRPARTSVSDQRAYAAAQAGVADYLQKLSLDNEYWLKCTGVPALPNGSPAAVNQVGANPRIWRTLAPQPNVQYSIDLLSRTTAKPTAYPQCQPNVDASMQAPDGTIQIRSTGRSGRPGTSEERHRSLVTTLRRNGFLDFLYFTQYEEVDPLQRANSSYTLKPCAPAAACDPMSIQQWAARDGSQPPAGCRQYVRDGRDSVSYKGSYLNSSNQWTAIPTASEPTCGSIQFTGSEVVKGPLHTDDTISLCGTPKFGRNRSGALSDPIDRVEYWAARQNGTGGACTTSGPDNGNNLVKTGTSPDFETLDLPDSNSQLLSVAQSGGAVYAGRTEITLNGSTMTVKKADGTVLSNVPVPANGVIYVTTSGSCPAFDVTNPYASDQPGCGDAVVSGTYSSSLTIAAARDVQIKGSLTYSNNALLGLIANNFIRVRNQMASYPCNSGTGQGPAVKDLTIQAAMLSLGHVFTVDNYACGDPLGTLNVKGAIAQKYRGPVGTYNANDGTAIAGYTKNYVYDDRLKYRSPPYFMNPVQSAWRIVRSTEQVPPA